ncbi:MAG: 3-deoxy-manno-octulosonate cytidylyltransferase [Marinobacter sp.]|uniref:3-deoxy-manno-octulosonate cytidylyltransferase n=1 Tax=Marinobacter sp. TaxID=50741 RepID=UPI00299D62DF|nr:3-deoxy-manno-octulosonate cytidylyltransferase [Marinobacter sp.]MDX1754823.1 3-deoxy-manno-octulosonate cytidylyltransferase [Marinobacter sp.]
MSFSVVIPARYASTRLPGKPLADIAGKPMIRHVYERAAESDASRIVIATDDERIRSVCAEFGAETVMTSPDHASGTDRLEEVARQLGFGADHCVVNVQGDEPLLPASLINQVAANLAEHPDASIATLCEAIADPASVFNPNVVKVVFDHRGMAHYFSRAPIPWARDVWAAGTLPDELPPSVGYYRHIGIYGYRVKLLQDFVTWPPAPTELTESLEQLRALYHGARIHVAEAGERPPAGVDTEADLERVRAWFESVSTR